MNPDFSSASYMLGFAFQSQGSLIKAREAFRNYLQGKVLLPEFAERAREAIAHTNETESNNE